MKNKNTVAYLLIIILTMSQENLVCVGNIPGSTYPETSYKTDPTRNPISFSTSTKNEAIEKVQDIYRSLSAKEKSDFNKAYRQLQDICQAIIHNHGISFNQSSNPTADNSGPAQR